MTKEKPALGGFLGRVYLTDKRPVSIRPDGCILADVETGMKLPDPVGWSYLFEDDGSLCQQFDTREEADRWVDSPDCLWAGYVSPLYSEAQVKELLAQADKQMVGKYEPVLKQALDALYWTTPIGGKPVKQTQDAMDAIRKVLG